VVELYHHCLRHHSLRYLLHTYCCITTEATAAASILNYDMRKSSWLVSSVTLCCNASHIAQSRHAIYTASRLMLLAQLCTMCLLLLCLQCDVLGANAASSFSVWTIRLCC
jgi:hypothetical protein